MCKLKRLELAKTALGVLAMAGVCAGRALAQRRDADPAQVTVHAAHEACAVELDAMPSGKTNAQGDLTLNDVDPTDHYIHVHCPGQDEQLYFVSPRAGERVQVKADTATTASRLLPLQAAQAKIDLRRLVQKAVQERAAGEFEAAIKDLHTATGMDPENSDLHRELGITFLLQKDWKRARVEMLEAIKHDPTDADAHNGLGYALEKLGDAKTALEEYRTATRLDPDDASYRQHYTDALGKIQAERTAVKKK